MHRAVNLSAAVRVAGALHVQNVNAYHSRFKQWPRRFNGVASRYLPNHLGWRWGRDDNRIGRDAAEVGTGQGPPLNGHITFYFGRAARQGRKMRVLIPTLELLPWKT